MKMISTRDAYGESLIELGRENPSIVVFDADVSTSTRTFLFGEKFPERFFNMGIAEQNMMAIAAGMSTCNKIPFVSSFASFCPSRCVDQIKQIIAQLKLNVKIVVTHAGLTAAADGSSHQAVEDISIMRGIPNFKIVLPADATETKKALYAAAKYDGPVYIRLNRAESPVIFNDNYDFKMDDGVLLQDGKDLTIIATGIMVGFALEAAKMLKKEGIESRIVNMHTIKPIDKKIIIESAKKTGKIITVEDHNVLGGLGSAVAEVLAESSPVPMIRIGIQDSFGESARDYAELRKKYGLTSEHIVEEAKKPLTGK